MGEAMLQQAIQEDGAAVEARERRSVLLVDDDMLFSQTLRRVLKASGFDVSLASDGQQAVDALMSRSFDAIVSDINMPDMSGISLLRAIRSHDLDVPVILMTGNPTVETAMEAISLGAMQYLAKPMNNRDLVAAVERASVLHQLTKVKREALELLGANATEASDRAGLHGSLDRALETMWMAVQPIVGSDTRGIFGYEALMRSPEPTLPHPGAILGAAERLDRLPELGRTVRALSAAAFETSPPDVLFFVNLHTFDLLDPELYSSNAPLTKFASRVVLEVTERAALDAVKDITARVSSLRSMGFRLALDDIGAGYAGLSSFVALEPEFVKLDMSLVRDVHRSAIRQRLIGSLTSLCKELGMQVVAEGIETREELETVRALRCDLFQGYLFARPGRPFPPIHDFIR
jgi:EAL domain-containing protein (putative c-di-GMP-specific phosphodiesterase class I)